MRAVGPGTPAKAPEPSTCRFASMRPSTDRYAVRQKGGMTFPRSSVDLKHWLERRWRQHSVPRNRVYVFLVDHEDLRAHVFDHFLAF